MNNILNLNPQNVWKHFYALTQIPRPSGQMQEITGFIETFGRKLGLETTRDAANNVCIRKPATPGYEKRPTVILQSHLDMVPQANTDTPFDFAKDKIQAYVDGDWVKAKGTTLGADNGIGVATTMAILEATDLQHGPLEGLFTTDEETGMYGALAIRPGFINGKIMLNLDSELDGELYIGCAGGVDITAQFQYQNEEWIPKEDVAVKVSLTGLKGGHSGVDIHLGRANANKLMFRFLKDASSTYDIRLASVSGGSLRNAIPREAFAILVVDGKERYERIKEMVAGYEILFNEEFKGIENAISFKAEFVTITPEIKLIPKQIQTKLVHAVEACPNNVISRFADLPDTVETSINMAIVKSSEGLTEVKFLARSSSESKKKAVCSSIESVFTLAGANFVAASNGYPGWDPNPKSAVLAIMERVFEQQRGEKPEVKVMHAGLECGIILANVPGLDTVSFGPTIQFPHSPDEKVEIASVQKFWDYLTAVLRTI
jgi:dipeptidase D